MIDRQNSQQPIVSERLTSLIEELAKINGLEIEIIDGKLVFNLEATNIELLQRIAESFGVKTVFRVISETFFQDALEFGTDKARLANHDLRKLTSGSGWDVHGIEMKAAKFNLTMADVFYARSHDSFVKGISTGYNPELFGVPANHSVILIYDSNCLGHIGNEGYVFYDSMQRKADPSLENKQKALIGLIRFKPHPLEFEIELNKLEGNSAKIVLLEKQIAVGLADQSDTDKALILGFYITDLIYKESLKVKPNADLLANQNISKLKEISVLLNVEIEKLKFAIEMESFIERVVVAYLEENREEMELTNNWPKVFQEKIIGYLNEVECSEAYQRRFQKIIEQAKDCQQRFNLPK